VFSLFILRFWNYLRGYICFRIEGLNLERFINIAVSRNIYLWDIKRINYTTIEIKAGAKNYKEIEDILKRTGCEGKIIFNSGWPFLVEKILKRKTIVIGLFFSLLTIVMLTSYIWTIDVNCENYILEKDIRRYLNKIGIEKGLLKSKINIPEVENKLLIHYERIAWVDIDIKGTKAIVNVVEKQLYKKKIKDTTPCDIVAKKNGIIEKIIPRQGDAMVKKGDVVKPNQVLISGTIKRDEDILRYVHSMGEIYAKTYYEATETLLIEKTLKERTGNIYKRRILKLGNTSIIIGVNKIPFEKYILETKNKHLKWRNIRIPVEFVFEEYYEIYEKNIVIKEDDLKKALRETLMVRLIPQIPKDAKILNKTMVYEKHDNSIVGKLIIEVLESIGTKRLINIPPEIETEDNINN